MSSIFRSDGLPDFTRPGMDIDHRIRRRANGLKIHKDGRIFVADYKRGIMQVDPATGKVTPYCERWRVESFKGVNDLVFDTAGNMYFTDQGLTGLHDPTGRVFGSPDGEQLDCLWTPFPVQTVSCRTSAKTSSISR